MESDNYFESYDNIAVHNLMLRDKPRVSKYREAILNSKKLFKDKIVLDVGSGTGLLSLFSAQAGAKHVYAVEASPGIYELSKAIIQANKLENKVTVINGEIEKIELPVEHVDIIVSEWMGFYLVHESMLGSVIYARNKWLKPDGLMYPSSAYLYVCPVEMEKFLKENLSYWKNYYGLDYEPVMKIYKHLLLEKPLIEHLNSNQLIDEHKIFTSINLKTIELKELENIELENIEFIANRSCNLHGFAFWFDVIFTTDDKVVTLSTGPNDEETHWKQTITFLPNALDSFCLNDQNNNNQPATSITSFKENDSLQCHVKMSQSEENPRNYVIDIGIELNLDSKNHITDANRISREDDYYLNDDDDDDDDYDDDNYDSDEEHPVPCNCGKMQCIIIKATLEKYEHESNTHV